MSPMLKLNRTKFLSILFLSFYISGCAPHLPQNELHLENVITEKQKKEALLRDKAVEQAKVVPTVTPTATVASNPPIKPIYPLVTPPPIVRPIVASNPIAVSKVPAPPAPKQSTESNSTQSSNATIDPDLLNAQTENG